MPGLPQDEPAPLAKTFGVQRADNFAPTKLRPLREITRRYGPAQPSHPINGVPKLPCKLGQWV
jgi:hypothetical protein